MAMNDGHGAVAAVLLVTVLLTPAVGYGGYAAGRELRDTDARAELASSPATPSATASPTPAAASATPSPSATGTPTELSREARELASSATVRLSPPSGSYLGSGSIVSPDGLVLTNAHVAQPTAPGLARVYGRDVMRELDPEQLVVSMTTGDGPAEPTWLADVVAVDGHLDLAVLKISAHADGRPLPDGLSLPHVPIGSVDDLARGDELTVYGYPALNQGDRLTVRPGVVGTFLPDPLGLVPGERYIVETTADFSGGNSGGMALSNDGALVGVPSSVFTDEAEQAQAHKLRAVDLAQPLLTAASTGAPYRSPYPPQATGQEAAQDLGWTDGKYCNSPSSQVFDDTTPDVMGRLLLTGMVDGEDVLMVLRDGGEVVKVQVEAYDPDDACTAVRLPKTAPEDGTVLPGAYELEVLVGPDRASVLRSSVTVTATGE
jgi:putative serine protease PepD